MKYRFNWSFLLLSLSLLAIFGGCKKEPIRMTEKPLLILTAKDSSEVRELCTKYMDLLKSNHYDEALDMLYCVDTLRNITKIPDSQKQILRRMLTVFPVMDYRLEEMKFVSEFDTKVKYSIEFFEKSPDDNRPNTTALFLRPIRKDSQWYLTVYDTITDNSKKNN